MAHCSVGILYLGTNFQIMKSSESFLAISPIWFCSDIIHASSVLASTFSGKRRAEAETKGKKGKNVLLTVSAGSRSSRRYESKTMEVLVSDEVPLSIILRKRRRNARTFRSLLHIYQMVKTSSKGGIMIDETTTGSETSWASKR